MSENYLTEKDQNRLRNDVDLKIEKKQLFYCFENKWKSFKHSSVPRRSKAVKQTSIFSLFLPLGRTSGTVTVKIESHLYNSWIWLTSNQNDKKCVIKNWEDVKNQNDTMTQLFDAESQQIRKAFWRVHLKMRMMLPMKSQRWQDQLQSHKTNEYL